LIRGNEKCPCLAHIASAVHKATRLFKKELKIVEKLMEGLGEYKVGE